jgi:CheY-like chemotaxis protein
VDAQARRGSAVSWADRGDIDRAHDTGSSRTDAHADANPAGDVASRSSEAATADRVLIVDDDASILRMLRVVFRGDGFDVKTATNGREALDAINGFNPGAIVLDLEMPVMDGREFFRQLRGRGDGTPVLILSAYGAERARAELGANAFVGKPFEPDELVRAVQQLIEAG